MSEKWIIVNRFFISNEKWKRLPLQSNYKEPKLMNLLSNFPEDNTQLPALFGNNTQNQSNLEEMSLEEIIKKNSALSSFSITFCLWDKVKCNSQAKSFPNWKKTKTSKSYDCVITRQRSRCINNFFWHVFSYYRCQLMT